MECSKANFNQVHNSAKEIFFAGSRMGAGDIPSKGCFGKFTEKHLLRGLFSIKLLACILLKKETPPQMFSCNLCKTFKNNFLTEHLSVSFT